jgi:hypothetical protein
MASGRLRQICFAIHCVLHQLLVCGYVACTQVWLDEHQSRAGSTSFLSLWRPVPPPGYVAMGYVAEKGPLPPPVGLVR